MGSSRPGSRVVARKAEIGKALFARTAFAADEQIGIVSGKVIRDPEYGSEYCVALDDQTSLEPAAPFRYLNHSCEPNCQLLTWNDEQTQKPTLALFSITDILPGAELTIDYAWSADAAIPCLCGKPTCRGWIVAESELADVKKVRKRKRPAAAAVS